MSTPEPIDPAAGVVEAAALRRRIGIESAVLVVVAGALRLMGDEPSGWQLALVGLLGVVFVARSLRWRAMAREARLLEREPERLAAEAQALADARPRSAPVEPTPSGVTTYRAGGKRALLVTYHLASLAIWLPMLLDGPQPAPHDTDFTGALVVVGLMWAIAIPAWWARMVVRPAGLELHLYGRTRTVAWSEVAAVVPGRSGLEVHQRDGTVTTAMAVAHQFRWRDDRGKRWTPTELAEHLTVLAAHAAVRSGTGSPPAPR